MNRFTCWLVTCRPGTSVLVLGRRGADTARTRRGPQTRADARVTGRAGQLRRGALGRVQAPAVVAELVERDHLPTELSQQLAQVRELTAPPDPSEEVPPLSAQRGQILLKAVRQLVGLAQEQTVKAGI